MNVLLLPVLAAVIVVGFVAAARGLQQRFGGATQNRVVAYASLGLAVALDILVVVFSISACTYAASRGLEIRGDALTSGIIRSVLGLGDSQEGVRVADLWGAIIPLISWVTAHGIVVGALRAVRSIPPIVQLVLRIRQAAGLGIAPGTQRSLMNYVSGLLGSMLLGVLSFLIFRLAIAYDKLLFQYQIIESSGLKSVLGGKGWAVRHSPEQLKQVLSSTFMGQMALHAGDFYMICLFVTATLLVLMLHRAWSSGGQEAVRPADPRIAITGANGRLPWVPDPPVDPPVGPRELEPDFPLPPDGPQDPQDTPTHVPERR